MPFVSRPQRWPSAWEIDATIEPFGRQIVEVRNVSVSGLRCACSVRPERGARVVLASAEGDVTGRVVRVLPDGAAIAFDGTLTAMQLAAMRQFRRLERPCSLSEPIDVSAAFRV